ncbi:hypothetical protein [Streptococcus suis]|uniref:hypothetical protein n=1 Tax=Streptococcus suis TaxID=1307 RepID=UPI00042A5140|nr:hypothetical protein [Streptococcus suis]
MVTGTGATAVGAAVGGFFGTFIPIPGAGTAIGVAIGIGIGSAIDNLKVNEDESLSDMAKNALTDLFGGDNGKEK